MLFRSAQQTQLARSPFRLLTTPRTRSTSNLSRHNGFRPPISRVSQPRKPVTLALTIHKPLCTSLQRYQSTTASPYDHIDKKHEEAVEREKLERHPDEVSPTSSVHQIFHEQGVEDPEPETDMLAGIKQDLVGHSTSSCVVRY